MAMRTWDETKTELRQAREEGRLANIRKLDAQIRRIWAGSENVDNEYTRRLVDAICKA